MARPRTTPAPHPPRRPLRGAAGLGSRARGPWVAVAILGTAALLAGACLAAEPASPPERCDDATFLRRATLDLAGRQPTPDELQAFVADGSPARRSAAVERLLDDPGWATTWARYFRDVVLYRRTDDRALAMAKPLEQYLAGRLRDGASWERIAREMITAIGTPSEHGETAIILAQMGETSDIAAEVSRVFLGIQIQCAQCHDHFTDRWKRDQFHHYAAFFPRIAIARGSGEGIDRFQVVSYDAAPRKRKGKKPDNPRRGDLEHEMPDKDDPSKPGTVMRPTFFLADTGVPLGTNDQERRQTVARAITSDDNPWFARAIVNRLWAELVGTGFYAGIDDLGPDREPREADVLDRLCRDFVAGGHDLRVLFRAIMATPAYQAESRSRGTAEATSASCPQRLRADQLFTQILAALDVDEAGIGGGAARGNAARPAFGGPRAVFMQVFGYDPSLPREEIVGSIPQALLLMNSDPLSRAIDGDRPRTGLARLLAAHPDDREAADAIYVRVLARHPSPAELQTCIDHVAAAGNREEGFEDVFWALINGPEFIHRK